VKLDSRARVHLMGVGVGAIVAIYAAIQSDWVGAIVFGVATALLGLGVAHRIRGLQKDA
jgi:hypothetical protein